ncbi:MAG TPA: cation:proton antiporter [Blastocatellia bacterium]|nr:cation:proton antiporter [Blastocatellia bacterium]
MQASDAVLIKKAKIVEGKQLLRVAAGKVQVAHMYAVASTVVLIRGLMDNGLLNTPYGQAAIGWLVFEDLATILILILMPGMATGTGGIDWSNLGLTLLKAAAFVVILLFVGKKPIPWILLKQSTQRKLRRENSCDDEPGRVCIS